MSLRGCGGGFVAYVKGPCSENQFLAPFEEYRRHIFDNQSMVMVVVITLYGYAAKKVVRIRFSLAVICCPSTACGVPTCSLVHHALLNAFEVCRPTTRASQSYLELDIKIRR